MLDDGFQHRRLARDLDIVAVDATDPFGCGRLFPRGLLREPLAGLSRAGAVVLTRADAVHDARRREIRAALARACGGRLPLVIAACAMLAWGAWQQVVVGLDSHSVVLGYPTALLPLPALLCAVVIGGCATWELLARRPLDLGHAAEVE